MALWLIQRSLVDEGEAFDVLRDGERMIGIEIPGDADVSTYRRAALMLRANVIRRLEDPEPAFAVDASDQDAIPFVEMLNAA